MSTTTTTSTASDSAETLDYSRQRPAPRRRRDGAALAGRLPLIAVLIGAIVCAGFVRDRALDFQADAAGRNIAAAQSKSALGNMNSFALALMLGGLRGPLVMMLWSTSEAQKADKDLEDFNTKVEWIRNLQPEFVTVHIFQIWNLAYNVSVQMASLPNRYACIMEALDYAREVDRGKPDDLNIMHAIAQVYSNKLGTAAQEKTYYRAHVRDDSLPRKVTRRQGDAGFQRRRMDPILDSQFNVLPEYLVVAPGHERPAGLSSGAEWNTGQELQFLKQYEPFPYGVSTYALAYNYSKRAEVLMNADGQQPLQISEMVVDSRPAMELKSWAEEEWERGRRFELEALGDRIPSERQAMESAAADLPLDPKVVAPEQLKKALDAYDNAVRLGGDSNREYERHLNKPAYIDNYASRESQLQSLIGMQQLVSGDAAYLRATLEFSPARRAEVLKSAAESYRQSVSTHEMLVLRHYITDSMAEAIFHASRPAIVTGKFTNAQRHSYYLEAKKMFVDQPGDDADDRREYQGYIDRAEARLARIDPSSAISADDKTPGGESSQPQQNPAAPPAPPQPLKP